MLVPHDLLDPPDGPCRVKACVHPSCDAEEDRRNSGVDQMYVMHMLKQDKGACTESKQGQIFLEEAESPAQALWTLYPGKE